jgi:hypothetical protein
MSKWKLIRTFNKADREEVDVWLTVNPSPRSFGMGDAWRVVDVYKADGKWLHIHNGSEKEISADYVTHWMEKPLPPKGFRLPKK